MSASNEDFEVHLLCRECPDAVRLELLRNQASCLIKPVSSPRRKLRNVTREPIYDNPPNNDTGERDVFTPALSAPTVEEGFKRDLGLGIKAILAEQTVVGRERKNDSSASGNPPITFKVTESTKSSRKCTEAHFRKPSVRFSKS